MRKCRRHLADRGKLGRLYQLALRLAQRRFGELALLHLNRELGVRTAELAGALAHFAFQAQRSQALKPVPAPRFLEAQNDDDADQRSECGTETGNGGSITARITDGLVGDEHEERPVHQRDVAPEQGEPRPLRIGKNDRGGSGKCRFPDLRNAGARQQIAGNHLARAVERNDRIG